ncbi:hypothetical protein [Actinacidiphila acidipaludis]|uniref:Uncharacterized protein n=1 Tax=Actinacidiphila acidipaludis TaxID=2873382 RepID=A0ABS7Q353_9ACTN|nr:hypothetical protein [Streptomyces acidipaludis]MBY8877581.1 hypothetical protein [Streptomyces acidipaludis]
MRIPRITGAVVATALVAGVTGGVLTATSATATAEAPHHSVLTSRPAPDAHAPATPAAADPSAPAPSAPTVSGVAPVFATPLV